MSAVTTAILRAKPILYERVPVEHPAFKLFMC